MQMILVIMRAMSLLRASPLLAALALILIAGCGSPPGRVAGRVAVPPAPQVDGMLRALAGAGVRVAAVVPATADLHDLELRPSQVRALRDADLVLRPGRSNDAWAQEALTQLDATLVDVSVGLPGTERHWWMDPTFAATAAQQVAAALDRLDPNGAAPRATALATFTGELRQLDRRTTACLASVPARARRVVTDHDAIGAYAARYRLSVVGTIAPGSEPQAAPSAQRIAALEAVMRRQGVTAVFPIAPHGSALARTVAERGGA